MVLGARGWCQLGRIQTHRRAAQRRALQRRAQPPKPPAARLTDLHTCPMQTPPCPTVLIGGKLAARMGDTTAHGGTIAVGIPTVMIGG